MYTAESFEHAGYRIKIIQDEAVDSPSDMDDDGLFIVTTRNRSFQQLHNNQDAETLMSDKEFCKRYWIFPLRAYVHSGVALSLYDGYPFSDQWDAGQIGFVFAEKDEWRFQERSTKKSVSARKAAEGHVETWNMYLSGDVWGYDITAPDGRDIDSLWGMYGLEYCKTEAKAEAERARRHEDAEAAKLDALGIPCLQEVCS